MGYALKVALDRLHQIANGIVETLPSLGLAILTFTAFYLVAKLVRSGVRRATDRRSNSRGAGIAVGRIAQGLVLLLGALVALSLVLPDFKPADIIQLLGISSVAIGFAFRDILQNFLAGILILLTHPFRIGDEIVTSNYEGSVEDIQTRATFIKTYDGRRVVIPNASLFTDKVVVNTAFPIRRLEYDVGIGCGDRIETAKELILEALHETEGVLPEPPSDALVIELGPSSVTIRARWWITPPRRADVLDARDLVLAAIKRKLQDNGIDLPFPTSQILFHDQTEEGDGDRSRQREGWPAGMGVVPRAAGLARVLADTAPCAGGRGEPREKSPGGEA